MKNLISKLLGQDEKPRESIHSEVVSFLVEFDQLRKEDYWGENLESKFQLIINKDIDEQWKYLPGLYLLHERALCTRSDNPTKFKEVYRRHFRIKYPALANSELFKFIFDPVSSQENALCHLLMNQICNEFTDITEQELDMCKAYHSLVDQAFELVHKNQLGKSDLQTTIKHEVSQLYDVLGSIIGDKQTKSLYQASYALLAENYGLLPSFSFIVSILPESALTEQQLSMLSRTQIETVLIEKTSRLEEANARLLREMAAKEKIQKANEENVDRLNRIIENAMDAVVLMDSGGRITFWNNQAETIFKWKSEEVLGKLLADCIIPEDKREEHERGLNYYLKVGKHRFLNRRIEDEGITKDGVRIPLELSIVANKVDGDVIFTSFIRDISDRKRNEEELMNAKEKAEQASKSKADFLSTMSHEIRTPMNGLSGTIDYLLDENPRQDQIDSLKLMRHSCESLLVILNDILDLSKIEEGHVEFDQREFSLREVCQHIMSTYTQRAEQKSIKLNLDLKDNVPDLLIGDPVRLSQILNNLVSNAIKFTLHGQVELKVQLLDESNSKAKLRLTVQDTGIGIAKGNIDKIFDRFTQVHDQSHNTLSGTGLGLSISKKLLQLVGSDLIAESELGTGSTFYFDVFFNKSEKKETKQYKEENGPINLEGIKILLVEDNQINQIVAAKFLKKWNCEVVFADNGEQALDQVMMHEFDLILMDIQMPIMNGYQAAEAIRQMPGKLKEIPIIALTADVLPEVREEALRVGMNDLMTKPFNADKLYQIIVEYLR
ncbi:MAG: hypothetical protein CMP48_21725 [Rickettsiales bacterium]|nr:hypothetical protein [Rickettsiales bacterium]